MFGKAIKGDDIENIGTTAEDKFNNMQKRIKNTANMFFGNTR